VRGGDGEEIGNPFFPGLGMAGGQKRGVYAGQSDEFSQKFFCARHADRVAKPAD
jgi:hypothetical protein